MNARKLLSYALGPVGGAAVGLVSLPLISWYYPPEDVARIMLLQTVASLVLLMMSFGLDQAYVREYHDADDKPALFKALSMTPMAAGLLLCAAVMLFKPGWPSEKILDLHSTALSLLCLLFFLGTLAGRYLALILRMQERALAFSVSQLTPKVLILVFVAAYVLSGLPTDTFTLILAYALAQTLAVTVLAVQTRSELKAAAAAQWSGKTLKESLRYGLPLAFGGLAYWGFTSADRFLLKELGGLSELGVYSMAVSFGAVALVFQSVFSTIWAPMVFKWVKENSNLEKISGIALTMTDAMAAVICLVGIFSPLVSLILPPQYSAVQFILLSSMLYPLLYTLTEVTGIGINVSRKTWLITVLSVFALLCNLILLYWLVPRFGARGAAAATAVSFWLFSVLKTEISARVWQDLPRWRIYGKMCACLLGSLTYTLWGNAANYYVFAAVWLCLLLALGFAHRQSLAAAGKAIKGRLKTGQT
ncbi:lipopolysaccharide biosynthesis protein [Neisseria sp.]|uniref:lipopolysaccharide biosynthesis protein n=1 Tax=Neisseria sp. TaxID=192066 RepID=UPI00359FFE5D